MRTISYESVASGKKEPGRSRAPCYLVGQLHVPVTDEPAHPARHRLGLALEFALARSARYVLSARFGKGLNGPTVEAAKSLVVRLARRALAEVGFYVFIQLDFHGVTPG